MASTPLARAAGVQLDLFANAWREEALWVAGDVVGFPDYPVAAFARLTPTSAQPIVEMNLGGR